jgi:hypothetical protein
VNLGLQGPRETKELLDLGSKVLKVHLVTKESLEIKESLAILVLMELLVNLVFLEHQGRRESQD